MNGRFLFIPVLLALPALVACGAVVGRERAIGAVIPIVPTTEHSGADTSVDDSAAPDCLDDVPGAHQLLDVSRGICFLYPDYFEVSDYDDGAGYTLVIPSLAGNHQSPVIWLTFEPAAGRSLEEVTRQRLADYAFPDTRSQAIILGNESASLMDNLPGQDTNRRVVAIHADRVIDLVIDHIGKNYGAAGEQAEVAYSLITGTLRFIDMGPTG